MPGSEEFERMKQQAMMNNNKSGGGSDMPGFMIPNTMFAFVGGLLASYLLFRAVKGTFNMFKVFVMGKGASGAVDVSKLGKWAVVTGATDGIGKAYAEELADEGMNIVLISRTQEKLDAVAEEIKKNSDVETKTIVADFTKTDIYDSIEEGLKDLDIGVLVNNVGVSYQYPEDFIRYPIEKHVEMLNVNCLSVLKMMGIVMPIMARKKLGAVINISSASGCRPSPLLASYSASKAFVDFLSKAVNTECLYAQTGIIIQSVTPFFVKTKLAGIRKSSFFVPEPGYLARSALNTLGVWDHTFGCFAHELQGAVVSMLPNFLFNIVFYRELDSARKRWMKKNKKTN